ncbi:putative bifunctional diguanylate cyclase/phosphodiesterase [Paenibacillus sp. FA6]|uniref:putative bifunctional diguanylate cyclase/phosphodiesterase n=1 Tax=Paenibacillus sp. FA6 TaxID=3413029 RepID=UPI003F655586
MLQRDKGKRTPDAGNTLHKRTLRKPPTKQTFSPLRSSIRISGIYFVVGCLWILLTDRAVSAFISNSKWVTLIHMIKGWLFVSMTAALIFFLILGTVNRIKRIENKLGVAYIDKVYAHESLESAYEEIIATEDELRQQYDQLIENQRKLTESEEKMFYLAYHDVLTGLPNKMALYENGTNTILAGSDNSAALMFVDIDNFKYINDTMGHGFGDRLIAKVSDRLLSIVANKGDVYRFGGDEFIILLHSIENTEEISKVADCILASFKEPVEMDNSLLHISISIGISIYPEHGNDIMELIKRADIAMHRAKEAGKGKIVVFDHPMNDTFAERMNIEKQLYSAMARNEFELFYQPQVDLALNKVTGLEALLRWNSPELGFVSPLKFIKIAEDSHLIIPLGAWVLRTACTFLKSLHDQGLQHLTISVNISMLQLLQTDFNELVLDTLRTCGLKPDYLELEITESILVESYDHVSSRLNELRGHNIRIALDDFGTGYSSLSYLTHLPISTLKIDKSFIDSIHAGTHQTALIEQIIIIGKRMNMCVVAEGVEQTVQLEYLQEQNCDKIQGYLFSKPKSAQDVKKLLTEWENTGIGTPRDVQYGT